MVVLNATARQRGVSEYPCDTHGIHVIPSSSAEGERERDLTSDCTCTIDAVGMLGSSAQSLILAPHPREETSTHRKVLSRLPSAGKLGMTSGDLKQKLVKPEMIDPANDCLTMCCMRCRSSRSAMTNY